MVELRPMDDGTSRTDMATPLEVADLLEAIAGALDQDGADPKRLASRLKALKEEVQQWTQAVRLLAPDELREKQETLDALAELRDCIEVVERRVAGDRETDLKALLEKARAAEPQLQKVSQIAESLRASLLVDDSDVGPKRGGS